MNERRRILKRSQRQEREGMARMGGRVNPGSGSGWARPNDGRIGRDVLVEFKRTDNKKSITLKLDDLLLVEQHGLVEGRQSVLVFELGGRNFVVEPQEDWLEARDALSKAVDKAMGAQT